MLRITILGLLALASLAPPAAAQIVIRAPFVRVQVGGGVSVQAPFVNFSTLPPYPSCYGPPSPATSTWKPPTREKVPVPEVKPAAGDIAAPSTVALTLGQFATSFQPREGSYEIVLVNPVTNAPTTVQFALPAGTPGVRVFRRELDFVYDAGPWVRIRFDRQGARVMVR